MPGKSVCCDGFALTSGLSLSYRYHAGIRLLTSEYFQRKGLAVF
jgi:hypothetical protein